MYLSMEPFGLTRKAIGLCEKESSLSSPSLRLSDLADGAGERRIGAIRNATDMLVDQAFPARRSPARPTKVGRAQRNLFFDISR